MTDTHYCPRCRLTLPLSAFGRRVVEGREYPKAYCHECERSYARQHHRSAIGDDRPTSADERQDARWRAIDEARAQREQAALAAITECPRCGTGRLVHGRSHDWECNTVDAACLACGWTAHALTTPRGRATSSVA